MGWTGIVDIQRIILLFFGSPAARLDLIRDGSVALRRQVALALLLSEQSVLYMIEERFRQEKNSVCAKNIKKVIPVFCKASTFNIAP